MRRAEEMHTDFRIDSVTPDEIATNHLTPPRTAASPLSP